MPLYDYKCNKCNIELEQYSPVDERHNQVCKVCGEQLIKKFNMKNLNLAVDRTIGKFDIGLGEYVESSSHRRQIMKAKGLTEVTGRPLSEQRKEIQARDKKEREAKNDKVLTETMQKNFAAFSPA